MLVTCTVNPLDRALRQTSDFDRLQHTRSKALNDPSVSLIGDKPSMLRQQFSLDVVCVAGLAHSVVEVLLGAIRL